MRLTRDAMYCLDEKAPRARPAKLVGLDARQLSDGRWCVSDGYTQRAPTRDEQMEIDELVEDEAKPVAQAETPAAEENV